jgi:hypothetical protein
MIGRPDGEHGVVRIPDSTIISIYKVPQEFLRKPSLNNTSW